MVILLQFLSLLNNLCRRTFINSYINMLSFYDFIHIIIGSRMLTHITFFEQCLVYNKNTQNCRGDSPKLQREIPQ